MMAKLTYGGLGAFLMAVIMVQVLGNDKFPFLIILILALNFVLLTINLVRFIGNPSEKTIRLNLLLGLILAFYVTAIIFLSRSGLVDSMLFLGFR